jgi:prepilin signal peptidase PulO-like enzyme (type II secretory pathway)
MLLEILLAALLGLLVGGVVNVLADDLPLRRSLRTPRYVSDDKKRAIHLPPEERTADPQEDDPQRPAIAWLGLTAFLFGRRTSPDGTVTLSWRYPLAEILTMLFMILTIYAVNTSKYLEDVSTLQIIFWLVYMGILSLIVVIDIEHKLILFVVIIPTAILCVIDAVITDYQPDLRDALIGGAAGFIVFFIMYNGGFIFTYVMGKLRGENIDEIAFGYGDVMMATVSGLMLGWQALIFAMFITVFMGAFGALLYLLSRRLVGAKYSAFTALPYGPYIVAGTIAILLYRAPITDFLLAG